MAKDWTREIESIINYVTVKQQRRQSVQTRAGVEVEVVCLEEGNVRVSGNSPPKCSGFVDGNLDAVGMGDYCHLCKKRMVEKDT